MIAIEAKGLQKVYRGLLRRRGQVALKGVDLSVPVGTAFGLIGPNGAGKTTFIKILLGVVRPSAGTVRVLDGDPEDPRVRARIGYLPERLHLPTSWSPLAFLSSVSRLKGLSVRRADLELLLGRVGLSGDAHRRIGGFSKGMRQRLGLAAALLGKPELLILDEPTDGIDPLGRVDVRNILAQELERGATLFLNSHLLAETERICDRVGILAQGQLVRDGKLDELCRSGTWWRVRFAAGFDAARLLAAGLHSTSEEGLWRVEAAEPFLLNCALDRARSTGALIIEVDRDAQDLESVLAAALRVAA